jgi:hypothetical protein
VGHYKLVGGASTLPEGGLKMLYMLRCGEDNLYLLSLEEVILLRC